MEFTEPIQQAPVKKKPVWLLVLILLVILALYFFTANARGYGKAEKLFNAGDYSAASIAFAELGQYRDAPERQAAAGLALAEELLSQRQYAQAVVLYQTLAGCEEKVQQCCYHLGMQSLDSRDLEQAAHWFAQAGDYSDAGTLYLETVYNYGHELFMDGQHEEAQSWFDRLADYPQYNIPHFVEPQEAIDYLKTMKDPVEDITVVVKNMHPYYEKPLLWNVAVQQGMGYQFCQVTYDKAAQSMHLKPSYYPGQRIVWAWQSGDFSNLTQEELQTYEMAMDLVQQAKNETEDIYGLEKWLHDWICDHVLYDNPHEYVNPEDYVGLQELTCVGALLNGSANCQGYTDAFYLLGTLAGLEVHKVFGAHGEEGHCWNAVRLDDRLYTVDVTFDDGYWADAGEKTYIWFNNALDINQYSVNGGVSQFDGMVILNNLSQTYYMHNDMVFQELDDAVYQMMLRYKENGSGVDYAVVDAQNVTDDDFYNAVSDNMEKAGLYSVQWYVGLEPYKEDTYITVYWE